MLLTRSKMRRLPGHERSVRFGVEHLYGPRAQTVAGQYLLWRKNRNLWKHRPSARKPNFSCARKMKRVKADVEEEVEYLGPAGNRGHAFHDANSLASLRE